MGEKEDEQEACHCRNQREPDLIPTIFLMPRSIIYSAVFMMLSAGLGLHMPTLVAGQILYGVLSLTDPLLMTAICVWAVHKTAIQKKPLIDLEYWKRRIARVEGNRED